MIGKGQLGPLMRKAKAEGWDRWVRSPADERAVLHGYVFREAKAQRVVQFFRQFLCHSKGRQFVGKPFELEEWQYEDIIGPVFGWVHRETLLRRIRDLYAAMAKKNGKSTMGSGLGLYLMIGDNEPGAEVYSVATRREQAGIVHREAIQMVKQSPALRASLRINETTGRITHPATNSIYAILSSDPAGAEGQNVSGLIADELHVWKGRAFWDALRYGGAARQQSLRIGITTAGLKDDNNIGFEQHDYAVRWLDNRIENDHFYAYIAAAEESDDPLDPATHLKANPNMGVTIDPDEIMREARSAEHRPQEMSGFLRRRLNIWVEATDRFFDMDCWDACADAIDEDLLIGRKCFGGVDMASTEDLAAWAILFMPTEDDPIYRLIVRCWWPEEGAERFAERSTQPVREWVRDGWLTLTPGPRIDYATIRDQIVSDVNRFGITDAGADPHQFEFLGQQLYDLVPNCTFYTFAQTMGNVSPPTLELEKLIAEKRIAHAGNPVLRWCAANSTARRNQALGQVRVDKKESKGKVDAVIAIMMALGRSMIAPPEYASTYEENEMVVISGDED